MTTILNLETRTIPLTRLDSGVYRVTGTRIPLERVIESHKAGATPQDIVDSFDTLLLADVHALIAFYLNNTEAVEQYLREQDQESERLQQVTEASQQPRPGFRKELLQRNALLEKDNAEVGR